MTCSCFATMTAMLQGIAPLAVLLEGGYNQEATAAATGAVVRTLLGQGPQMSADGDYNASSVGLNAIEKAILTQVGLELLPWLHSDLLC